MTFTLVAMDPQYDYLPNGSIDAYGSAQAVRNIGLLAPYADICVVTRDWHPENHFSFAEDPQFEDHSWPPHGVQHSKGAKIFPAIRKHADYVISKGMNRNPPDDYSAFTGKTLRPVEDLTTILRRNLTDDIVIGGFLFEIGVTYTAFDANALGWWRNVIIPRDLTGTLDLHADTSRLSKVGIQVVDTWQK